jgi:arylsulfatase A-like enzyme
MDLAPTAMHIMGLEVPGDMDGRPLVEILEERREVQYSEATEVAIEVDPETQLTPAETAEIEERLRSLGYLE